MKASKWKNVLDPYEWLPSYGESAVTFRSHGNDLVLVVEYEAKGSGGKKKCARELMFRSVCAFYKAAFPGPGLLDIEPQFGEDKPNLGWLIEYTDSEAAQAWQAHFAGWKRIVKHYQIAFLAENILCVVFAEQVILGDETLVTE
jgi:hypothetical protein